MADLYVPADHPTVVDAVVAAEDGDVVHVAAGTWNEYVPIVVLGKAIAVIGDPGATIVANPTPNDAAVFEVSGGGNLTLENLTVDAAGTGGVRLFQSTLTATELVIRSASLAILAEGATVSFVSGSTSAGAHVVARTSDLSFLDTAFQYGEAFDGTVLDASSSTVTFDGVDVTGGVATQGSLIRTVDGELTVLGSTFEATSSGGALLSASGTVVAVDDSELLANTSGEALISALQCPFVSVHGTLLCDNLSGEGTVAFEGSDGTFTNNVVRLGSSAALGVHAGGGATVAATNNTLVGTASSRGSALSASYDGVLVARNNVVAYSRNSGLGALWAEGGHVDFAYGLLYDNAPFHATGVVLNGPGVLLDVDPGFGPPAKGTCTVDDLVPEPGSPLVDAGDPQIVDVDGTISDLGATGGPDPYDLDEGENGPDDEPPDPCAADADHDGVGACEDCDDADPQARPGLAEVCDHVDQDCDGLVDEDATDRVERWPDADGDGFGGPESQWTCDPPAGFVDVAGDCDDTDGAVFPGAPEAPDDGVDQDCDGGDRDSLLGGAVGAPCGCRSAPGAGLLGLLGVFFRRRPR